MAIKRATVRAVKNIPTLVGKTAPVWRCNHRPWKHPHVRGGDKNNTLVLTCDVRNIPTPVGKTRLSPVAGTPKRKHPHARGEDCGTSPGCTRPTETSPRPWGRRNRRAVRSNALRNIPTPVGKTMDNRLRPHGRRKHPHARGEDPAQSRLHIRDKETSPRPWGRQ